MYRCKSRKGVRAIFGAALSVLLVSGVQASVIGFGGSGAGYTLNGGATVTSDTLNLTDAVNGQTRSAFNNSLQSLTSGGWTATFTYTFGGDTNPPADGPAFVLQNAQRAPSALGAGGGA